MNDVCVRQSCYMLKCSIFLSILGWIMRLYHNTSRSNSEFRALLCRLYCQYPIFDPCQVDHIYVPSVYASKYPPPSPPPFDHTSSNTTNQSTNIKVSKETEVLPGNKDKGSFTFVPENSMKTTSKLKSCKLYRHYMYNLSLYDIVAYKHAIHQSFAYQWNISEMKRTC